MDLGLHRVQRASLKVLCQNAVLLTSSSSVYKMKKKYSFSSAISSTEQKDRDCDENDGDHSVSASSVSISALKHLQKERLIVSRLGFQDKAFEIDKEIDLIRENSRKERIREENILLDQRMKLLSVSHSRKQQRLEFILIQETKTLNVLFNEEEEKCLKRQEIEFLRVLEGATRRAIGRVKKCNCTQPYLCRHNKTASYNTRRPSTIVLQYRRNCKRLRLEGRPDEAAVWEQKAKEIDEIDQDKWCQRVCTNVVSSPWGANEGVVDQITALHKKELDTLHKSQAVKKDMHDKQHEMRKRNFHNSVLAEERKVILDNC